MNSLKISLFLIASLQCIFAEKLVLDLHSDEAKRWLEITCLYNDDYKDFWVYGYPVDLPAEDDVYGAQRGFWTPGLAQRCELHYYGGALMPPAKSLTLGLYLQGSPEILVSSKYGMAEEEYTDEVGKVSKDNGLRWFETTIELTNPRALVLNFTLISDKEGDLLLLDKIVLDLGDDTTAPTEAPPTTTGKPVDDNNVVNLDTDNDYWNYWESDCVYSDEYSYIWAYGCPEVQTEEEDDGTHTGYWGSCSFSYKPCTLRMEANSTVLWKAPELVRIRGYVDGQAKINVTVQNNRDEICDRNKECEIIGVLRGSGDEGGKWTEIDIPVKTKLSNQGYKINIELMPTEGSTVILDKVELHLTPPDQGDKSAGGIAKMEWGWTVFVLILSVASSAFFNKQ